MLLRRIVALRLSNAKHHLKPFSQTTVVLLASVGVAATNLSVGAHAIEQDVVILHAFVGALGLAALAQALIAVKLATRSVLLAAARAHGIFSNRRTFGDALAFVVDAIFGERVTLLVRAAALFGRLGLTLTQSKAY